MTTVLNTEWRYLAMAHYRVEPPLVARFVPVGTELDDRNGEVFLTLVAFRFMNTKIFGVGIPFHRDFEEVNLRIYVRRRIADEIRRGVVFIKDIVGLPAVAITARLAYNERYEMHPTRSNAPREAGPVPARLEYRWLSRSGWNRIAVEAGDGPFLAAPGSQDQFLTDRPWGYTRQRDGGTVEYKVDHPPWRLWRARSTDVHVHATELYGSQFEPVLRSPAHSVTIAEGSGVAVSSPTRVA
jgi:uncharacterized protein YqjF (DUF2071 family)